MSETYVERHKINAKGFRAPNDARLAEADHRIANSLSLVAAMLRMQGAHISQSAAQMAILNAEARVLSIAHLHKYLHTCASNDGINLADIFTEFLPKIEAALGMSYRLAINTPRPLFIAERAARQLMIIINELAMNARKHGYASREGGCIFIELDFEGEDQLRIRFADGGAGLADGFSSETGHGLGLKIVHSLVHELGGSLSLKTDRRPYFTMAIPIDGLEPGSCPARSPGH